MAQNKRENPGLLGQRRWILWTAGAIVAIVLLASFVSRDDSVPISVASVSRRTIRSVISTNGKVEPVHNFDAHAPVATTVKRVLVREGAHVKRGQLLVELDAANARSQAAQALAQIKASEADISALHHGGTQEELLAQEAELVKARVDADTAKRSLEALQRLAQSGAASPGEVRAAQAQLDAASAHLKMLESKQKGRYSQPEVARVEAQQSEAQSAYSAAQDVVNQLVIHAPFDGVVYSLPVKQGDYVNPGDLILQEADLSQVRVRAFVDEPDIARLSPGQKIEVTWDAMPGRIWTGSVNTIPSVIKQRLSRNIGEITCIVPNDDFKLLPNINVGVTIITAEHTDVLAIPREALREDDSVPYVFQVVNNELHRTNIQTSISNLTSVEVTNGLGDGAVVALSSLSSKPLRDRLSVRVVH